MNFFGGFAFHNISFFCFVYFIRNHSRNPFLSLKHAYKQYHIAVWTGSLITTIILLSVPGASGMHGTTICWVKMKDASFNGWAWLLFYIPLILYYLFTIFSFFDSKKVLDRGKLSYIFLGCVISF